LLLSRWDESARPNKNIRDIDTATDSALKSENLQLLFYKNIDGFELLLLRYWQNALCF
jgi:hypothetical protein